MATSPRRHISSVPCIGATGDYLKAMMHDKLVEHTHYIALRGQDLPEVRDWKWDAAAAGSAH